MSLICWPRELTVLSHVRLTDAETTTREAEAEASDTHAHLSEQLQALQAAAARVPELEASLDAAFTQCREITQQKEASDAARNEAEATAASAQQRVAALGTRVQELSHELQRARDELQQAAQSKSPRADPRRLARVEKDLARVRGEAARLRTRLKDALSAVESAHIAEAARSDCDRQLRASIDHLHQQLQRERDSSRSREDRKDATIEALRKKLDAVRRNGKKQRDAVLERTQGTVNELASQVATLKARLREANEASYDARCSALSLRSSCFSPSGLFRLYSQTRSPPKPREQPSVGVCLSVGAGIHTHEAQ